MCVWLTCPATFRIYIKGNKIFAHQLKTLGSRKRQTHRYNNATEVNIYKYMYVHKCIRTIATYL